MTGPTEALRGGAWLTRERMRLVAWAVLVASLVGLAWIVATSDGLNDRAGRPLGTDFSNVYAAGTYVLDGEPARPFDPAAQHARERAIFGRETPFYGWHYPPYFLGLAALLALMPYGLALLVWQGATLGLYLAAIGSVLKMTVPSPQREEERSEGDRTSRSARLQPTVPGAADLSPQGRGDERLWLLLALAFPAVFINIGHGHNGFLTAALFAGALIALDRKPLIAGLLFGLLAYKPQFGVLIPLALIAGGYWRAIAAAAATVAALTLGATLAFGPEVWRAFFASGEFTRTIVLEAGGTGWHKIQSVFALARMWGAGLPLAYALQGIVTLGVAASLVWLWHSRARFALKAAALMIGAILATPYSLDYDLMLLAPAIAILTADGLSRGFAPYEKTLLAALWIVPLVARSIAEATLIPLGAPLMLIAFAYLLRRAAAEHDAVAVPHIAAE